MWRRAIRWLGRTLVKSTVLLTIAAIVLALLVWFAGPYLGYGGMRPAEGVAVRLGLLLLIALAWGIGGYFIRIRRNSEERALLDALRRQRDEQVSASEQERASVEAEFGRFRDATRAAIRFLGKGRGGAFANPRYALPWYFVLGTDDAGKSALIGASGLAMPFEGPEGDDAARFHISEKAVLVEFAGRLLDPADHRASALWPRMLDHLRRQRPQQPLNGILVTIPVDRLNAMSAEQCADLAASLRRRIDEIGQRLRTRAPVYVALTKLDLIVGFSEYFDTLDAEERAGVVGFPLAAEGAAAGEAAQVSQRFAQGFADLVERMSAQQMLRLHEEPDELRRRRMLEFSGQLAQLRTRLEPIVTQIASAHRFSTAPLVRGVFLTSARQTGDISDALGTPLATEFGQKPAQLQLAAERGGLRGRPYFVSGLVNDVLIPEASMSGLTRPARIATRAQGLMANAILTVLAIALLAAWWLAFSEGRAYTERLGQHIADARQTIVAASPEGQGPTSFEPALLVLNNLREIVDERPQHAPLGLYSTASVEQASGEVYDRGLVSMLFPFVWRYLSDGLDNPMTAAAMRFQQLKFYLMLGGERPLEAGTAMLIAPDFASLWLPFERTPEVEAAVTRHFAALADVRIERPLTDMNLVDRARRLISDYSLARLAYDVAVALPVVRALPLWRPVDNMGLAGPQALARVSGRSFWDGIRGFYTKAGFDDVALSAAATVSNDLAEDLWVMGMPDTAADRDRESARIREGLLDLYRVDYIQEWDTLLSDLTMIDAPSAGEVARALALIIGQPSPVKELATSVAIETRLVDPPAADGLPPVQTRLGTVDVGGLSAQRVANVARGVTEHFRAFREAVVPPEEGQQAQIDVILAAMEPLYRQINHVATGGDILELGAEPQTLLNQLNEQVATLPESLQPLFRRILAQAAAVTGGSSRERLSEIWSTTVLPLCRSTTAGRYPFEPGSQNDAALADFAGLFGPAGAIASFRNDFLRPFIDTTTKPWRWRTGQQVGLGISDEVLADFELASDITLAYFGESEAPAVNFTVEAVSLDSRARAFQLDLGGPVMVYSHGPGAPTPFKWPADDPAADAIMSMTPEIDGERSVLRRQGPWALFRLFDAGRILARDTTDIVPYEFSVGSRDVRLHVTAPPTANPFARDILSGFRCPVL